MLEPDASVQEALRSHRWLLDAMLGPFPGGSFNVFDRDLRYLYAAGTGLNWIGRSPDMLIGRRVEDVFPAEFVARVRPFYVRALAGETVAFPFPVFARQYNVHVWPLAEPNGAINAIVALAQEAPTVPDAEVLSPQLGEVAALIAAGLTNQQIAERLQLDSVAVRGHVEQIRQLLGFASRTQIGAWAVACGLYRPQSEPH